MLLTVVKLSRLERVHWAQKPVRKRTAEGLRLGILSDTRYRRVTQTTVGCDSVRREGRGSEGSGSST